MLFAAAQLTNLQTIIHSSIFSTMIFAFSLVILSILSVSSAGRVNTQLVVTRQDSTRTGFIEKVDPSNGLTLKQADAKFVFKWPHVEMTHDSNTDDVYVIAFPDDYPGPVLYQLDHNLNEIYTWVNTPYSFFDLQYSANQAAMYGILVTTTYGRALSNFTLDQSADTITASELYTLPYMWYVNASSFDTKNSRYFALINNFPGFENSTLDQQLIVADFSQDATTVKPEVGLFPIASQDMLVQFLTYSDSLRTLFCAGMSFSTSQAQVAIMDQETGVVTKRIFERNATAVGPLMYLPPADARGQAQLTVYVQTSNSPKPVWELWSLTLQHSKESGGVSSVLSSQLVSSYSGDDFTFFAGATITK